MSKLPFPKGPYSIAKIGDVERVVDANGNDVMREPGGMQRLVDSANAFGNKIWFPLNHLPATEERCARLDELRKAAWARVAELVRGEAAA